MITATTTTTGSARPFVKWAGGKARLANAIMARFPERYGTYHEPFLGGGAVFFALRPTRARLSDVNAELINAYRTVRTAPIELGRRLQQQPISREHFYAVRSLNPQGLSEFDRAARFIYLNKTCFNGLYRVNREGRFNVPFGRPRPQPFDTEVLRASSEALERTDLATASAFDVLADAERGDLVYLDPPYAPLSPTASFTGYTPGGFGADSQAQLAELFFTLERRGVHVVATNADVPLIRHLYRHAMVTPIRAKRSISVNTRRRRPVTELVIGLRRC
ncbi:MAG: DNA adenine methylase [Myxococcota bacterium]